MDVNVHDTCESKLFYINKKTYKLYVTIHVKAPSVHGADELVCNLSRTKVSDLLSHAMDYGIICDMEIRALSKNVSILV